MSRIVRLGTLLAVGFAAVIIVAQNQNPEERNRLRTRAGEPAVAIPEPSVNATHVPIGYRVEMVMQDLVYPTSVEFDKAGNLYVAEGGYSFGAAVTAPARIIRVTPNGRMKVVASELSGPVTDLLWGNDGLYISQRGKISLLDTAAGAVRDLITGLPSDGDYQNNQLALGPDGKIYFGQGTATNSGVVGLDNYQMGWLAKNPGVHDIPPQEIVLRNTEYQSIDPLTQPQTEMVSTGPFLPFAQNVKNAHSYKVKADVRANGTILRMNRDGSGLEVYAWGLRNPAGVLWAPDGKLYVTENGFDVRGSRPIANDTEDLYAIKEGGWYGWPDYAGGRPVTDPRFAPPRGAAPQFLMENHPPVEKPLLMFPPHAGIAKLDASPNDRFGRRGDLFVAFQGYMIPTPASVPRDGHPVVRINLGNQKAETFFAGLKKRDAQPATGVYTGAETVTDGPRRPVDVRFSPDGQAMYIVDFGASLVELTGPRPLPGSGVIWRVVPKGVNVTPQANLSAKNANQER
ncbi:MAG: PQQ-dependent sugar dehydrogenase [Bryobacteraceae bacterium]